MLSRERFSNSTTTMWFSACELSRRGISRLLSRSGPTSRARLAQAERSGLTPSYEDGAKATTARAERLIPMERFTSQLVAAARPRGWGIGRRGARERPSPPAWERQVAPGGVEPPHTDSKSVALPLSYGATLRSV